MPPVSGVPSQPAAAGESAPTIETDALVIGAGPVGLFQVFELGLQDIRAHVIDALPHPGGQCIELYPDKPIYDIPALPVCTGRELTDRLLRQIEPFATRFHLGQVVQQVQRQADGRLRVVTSSGAQFLARTLFIASGVGAFMPRRLPLPGLAAFEGTQVFYNAWPSGSLHAPDRVIVGGDDAALQAALDTLADAQAPAPKLTLVHRRDVFRAEAQRVEQMRAAVDAGAMRLLIGQIVAHAENDGRLVSVDVLDNNGHTHTVQVDGLLACLGLSPKLGPIAEWGLAMQHKQLVVDTAQFQTSEPGIFAVGDINTYPGKKKLILCGFHEATLAAFGAAVVVYPDRRVQLQYTTTSTQLHRALGVSVTSTHD